jgi:hypothetical protein
MTRGTLVHRFGVLLRDFRELRLIDGILRVVRSAVDRLTPFLKNGAMTRRALNRIVCINKDFLVLNLRGCLRFWGRRLLSFAPRNNEETQKEKQDTHTNTINHFYTTNSFNQFSLSKAVITLTIGTITNGANI